MLKRILLGALGVGIVFAIVWQLRPSKGVTKPDEVVIDRESPAIARVPDEDDEGLFEIPVSFVIDDEYTVPESGEDPDVDYEVVDGDNASIVVLYAVTNSLRGSEMESLASSEFMSSYDSFLEQGICQQLAGVSDFDDISCDFDNGLVSLVVDGESYDFRFTLNVERLLAGIEYIGG